MKSSCMALEAIIAANLMGIKTILSEHSLFDLGDFGGVHLNKVNFFFNINI